MLKAQTDNLGDMLVKAIREIHFPKVPDFVLLHLTYWDIFEPQTKRTVQIPNTEIKIRGLCRDLLRDLYFIFPWMISKDLECQVGSDTLWVTDGQLRGVRIHF